MESRGRRWKIPITNSAMVKKAIASSGASEDAVVSGGERWRLRKGRSVFTMYGTGILYGTDVEDGPLASEIDALSEEEFARTGRDILIGLDESGKGEVIGDMVLCGAKFPASIYDDVRKAVGSVDTKTHRSHAAWQTMRPKIAVLESKGLVCSVRLIPPARIDKHNINSLMDDEYRSIMKELVRDARGINVSMVLDDYGTKKDLGRYMQDLEAGQSVMVIVTTKADDNYLEVRLASVLARMRREEIMDGIQTEYGTDTIPVGSGNSADPVTQKWLEHQKESGRPWPDCVRRTYSPIRSLDGKHGRPKKSQHYQEGSLDDYA